MKKKYLIIISIIVICIVSLLVIFLNKEYPDDENTLYTVTFGNIKLRVERYDYSLGQNQIVGVEKSTNRGKDYEKVTSEPIIVSMKPKFIFINKKIGFAIIKPNFSKTNNYMGVKVTHDGGISFIDGKINYDNPDIETITVEDVPYVDGKYMKLPCSIYQVKGDNSGYEDKSITFISSDNGLTWYLEESEKERYEHIRKDIDEEMNRYLYYIAPSCNSDNAGGFLTHKDLVYNNGYDKEKLIDVDYKSYCKAYIKYKCVEKGKWEWKTTISCNNYTDQDYQDWDEPF